LFFDHGGAAEDDPVRFVVGFEGRKIQAHRAHVVVGVDIEHGGDAGLAAEPFDVFNGSGMGADKEARKDLRVGQFFARESTHFSLRFQVSTDFGGLLGGLRSMCVEKQEIAA
jgi:hypothetical protein